MRAVGPLESPNGLSKGHFSSMVCPEASTSDEKDHVNLCASEENMSYTNRENGAAKEDITFRWVRGEQKPHSAFVLLVFQGLQTSQLSQ